MHPSRGRSVRLGRRHVDRRRTLFGGSLRDREGDVAVEAVEPVKQTVEGEASQLPAALQLGDVGLVGPEQLRGLSPGETAVLDDGDDRLGELGLGEHLLGPVDPKVNEDVAATHFVGHVVARDDDSRRLRACAFHPSRGLVSCLSLSRR